MEILLSLLPFQVTYALNSQLFGMLTGGANIIVSVIKWAALLWVLVKVSMLGFKIATKAKDSSSAITMIKDEGIALLIGLFVVTAAFTIHNALKDTVSQIGKNSGGGTVDVNNSDNFDF